MPRISKRLIDTAPLKDTDYFIWDSDMPGFGLRVMASGKKSFMIQYRHGGRTRRVTFGRAGIMTPDEARKEARELLTAAGKGASPADNIQNYRKTPKVADICDRFMTEYVPTHCKASTEKEYQRAMDLFIKPAIGQRKITDITRTEVAKLHHDYRSKPYQANRTLGVLSVMFNQCEIWGLRPDGSNPCRHVKKYAEKKRERFLSEEELKRLWATLDACEADGSESAAACNAFRLLILTGCRLGEIQTLKWEFIKPGGIYLPESKTGAKKVYIGKDVQELLEGITREEDNPYVIPGTVESQHLTDLQKPWRRIRKKAGLPDVRIHDLRHSFASFGLASGLSLAEIGKLLGHSQVQTTARYAHLAEKIAEEAADTTSSGIMAHLKSGDKTTAA